MLRIINSQRRFSACCFTKELFPSNQKMLGLNQYYQFVKVDDEQENMKHVLVLCSFTARRKMLTVDFVLSKLCYLSICWHRQTYMPETIQPLEGSFQMSWQHVLEEVLEQAFRETKSERETEASLSLPMQRGLNQGPGISLRQPLKSASFSSTLACLSWTVEPLHTHACNHGIRWT